MILRSVIMILSGNFSVIFSYLDCLGIIVGGLYYKQMLFLSGMLLYVLTARLVKNISMHLECPNVRDSSSREAADAS